jgi:hypothetical protein
MSGHKLSLALLLCLSTAAPLAARAQTEPAGEEKVGDPDLPWLDNAYYKVDLQVRPRIELAKIDGLESAQAYTIRTHVGIGTKPWEGFATFVQLENVWSLDDGSYNDGAQAPNGQTTIADPETTELNQAFLQFERDDLLRKLTGDGPDVNVKAKGGRQAIVLDDARFIGNVDWRQNEQTMDAARGETDFGIDALTAEYAYLWDIRRVYGDHGGPATQDYSSDSHLARVHYGGFDAFDVSAFAYFLDLESDSPANSSNSYGARIVGRTDFDETWALDWVGSYAVQTDAASNPDSYVAHYVWVSGDLVHADFGKLGVVYEMLGSDDGNNQFVTPLATAHKFNGYADAFLDNGGPGGLQDLHLRVSPALPWKLEGSLIYHAFFSADGGHHLGREFDGVVTRRFNDYLVGLVKFAWYDGDSRGPADRWRMWFQVSFEY